MTTIEEERKARRKQTGEDFTPSPLVNEILDKFPNDVWKDPTKTWLDPTAGNGNFLVEIKTRLLAEGHSEQHILNNMIFGVDLMPDNCEEMIVRLYGAGEVKRFPASKVPVSYRTVGLKYCFKFNGAWVPNIVCADGLEYDYSFGREPDPFETFFGEDNS